MTCFFEASMHGGNNNVEFLQYAFIKVQIPIRRDFHFCARQKPERPWQLVC